MGQPEGRDPEPRAAGRGNVCRRGWGWGVQGPNVWEEPAFFHPGAHEAPVQFSQFGMGFHLLQSPDLYSSLPSCRPGLYFQPRRPSLSMLSRGTFNKHQELGLRYLPPSHGVRTRGQVQWGLRLTNLP